jgi:HlyD family secretion protein
VRANSVVTQNVVTYPTIISVQNDELRLLPGMTANVIITTARRQGVVHVPNAALRFRPPEGAVVRPVEVAAAPTANGEKSPAEEGLTIDQVPGLEQVPAEFRQRIFDRHDADKNGRLNPAELAALSEARARFAAGGGGRGPGGGGGNGGGGAARAARPPTDVTRTVYVVAAPGEKGAPAKGELITKTVKIGVTDGANTEIVSGLNEGDVLAVGIIEPGTPAAAAQANNPFAPQFPGARGGRR